MPTDFQRGGGAGAIVLRAPPAIITMGRAVAVSAAVQTRPSHYWAAPTPAETDRAGPVPQTAAVLPCWVTRPGTGAGLAEP